MKVKIFKERNIDIDIIEKSINYFLEENHSISVYRVLQCESDNYLTITIFYTI